MKTKLLRRLRKRAKMDIAITARVFLNGEVEYQVGMREHIKACPHRVEKFRNKSAAVSHLHYLRREYIRFLLDLKRLRVTHELQKKVKPGIGKIMTRGEHIAIAAVEE